MYLEIKRGEKIMATIIEMENMNSPYETLVCYKYHLTRNTKIGAWENVVITYPNPNAGRRGFSKVLRRIEVVKIKNIYEGDSNGLDMVEFPVRN